MRVTSKCEVFVYTEAGILRASPGAVPGFFLIHHIRGEQHIQKSLHNLPQVSYSQKNKDSDVGKTGKCELGKEGILSKGVHEKGTKEKGL